MNDMPHRLYCQNIGSSGYEALGKKGLLNSLYDDDVLTFCWLSKPMTPQQTKSILKHGHNLDCQQFPSNTYYEPNCHNVSLAVWR